MHTRVALLGAGAAALVGALVWRSRPSACPYSLRFLIEVPRPVIGCRRLLETLAPQSGEQMLELGPGTGFYTLDVAKAIAPGRLAIFDVQQEMLDHTMREADRRGVRNLEPTQGDARSLPYADASFDAVFMVTVLGEVPDQDAALAELARVLKPGGRLVNGEIVLDPDFVGLRSLEARARAHGLELDDRSGIPLAYFARLVKRAEAQNPTVPGDQTKSAQ